MKNIIRIISLLLALCLVAGLAACGSKEPEGDPGEREIKTKVAAVKDETGFGAFKIMTDRSYAYDMKYYDTVDEVAGLIKDGSVDIAVLPLDTAAKIYNETGGKIQMLCTAATGGIHALAMKKEEETTSAPAKDGKDGDVKDEDTTASPIDFEIINVESIEDFRGRTVWMNGTDSLVKCLIETLIKKSGVGKDIELKTADSDDEIIKKATTDRRDIYILPVLSAMKIIGEDNNPKQAFSLTREWNKLFDTPPVTACVVAGKDYIEANPDIISEFLTFIEVSLNYTATSETLGQPLVDAGLFDDIIKAANTVSGCNYHYLEGAEAKEAAQATLEILCKTYPDLAGGKTPGDDFYYIAT